MQGILRTPFQCLCEPVLATKGEDWANLEAQRALWIRSVGFGLVCSHLDREIILLHGVRGVAKTHHKTQVDERAIRKRQSWPSAGFGLKVRSLVGCCQFADETQWHPTACLAGTDFRQRGGRRVLTSGRAAQQYAGSDLPSLMWPPSSAFMLNMGA